MSDRKRRRKSKPLIRFNSPPAIPWTSYPGRVIVLLMLLIAPWLLGSLSGWAQFGLTTAALVALGLWFLEVAITRPKRVILPLSVLPILLGVGLGVLQCWPLSEEVKQRLGAAHSQQQWETFGSTTAMDRDIADQLELQTGVDTKQLELPERLPISIDPQATRLMTVQLLVAAICYLLGAHYFQHTRSLVWLCLLLTLNGVVLAGFGMLQKMTGAGSEIFVGDLAVGELMFGPYVNRNNAAGWLVMAMAAAIMLVMYVFADEVDEVESQEDWYLHAQHQKSDLWFALLRTVHELNAKKLAAVFAVVFIVGGVLATLSRGGTLAMILGSVIGFLVIGVSSPRRSRQGVQYLAVAVVMGLLLVGWLGFGQKLMDRFEQADKADLATDARVETWRDTWPLFSDQWLVGSGLHTYQHVHRPMRTTAESTTYVFAENQYFQTLIDAGAIGAGLLILMLGWSIYQVSYLIKRARSRAMVAAGTLGSVALGAQAVSAFFDFGLYMPANTITFAVLMGAVAGQAQYQGLRDRDREPVARWGWGIASSPLLLLLLGAGIVGVLQHFRLGKVENALLHSKSVLEKASSATVEEVDASILDLTNLTASGTEANLHDALGQQWLLRYRVSEMSRLQSQVNQDLQKPVLDGLWESTSLSSRLAVVRQWKAVSPATAERAEQEFFASSNNRLALIKAYGEFLKSRRANPLRPELHLRLADSGRWFSSQPPGPHLDRATMIGPQNARYHLLAGIQKLESINFEIEDEAFEPAMNHLRKVIDLDTNWARTFEPLVLKKAFMGVQVDGLTAETYARELLVDHPNLLFDFVNRNAEIKQQPELRMELLLDAKHRLDQRKQVFNRSVADVWAMGQIEELLENWEAALEHYQAVLRANPSHGNARYRRVLVRIKLRQLDEAEREVNSLLEESPDNAAYKRALQEIHAERLNGL